MAGFAAGTSVKYGTTATGATPVGNTTASTVAVNDAAAATSGAKATWDSGTYSSVGLINNYLVLQLGVTSTATQGNWPQDDLSMLLRKNNIFTFADVEYGIIEPNGQLSVLKNPELEYTTKKDINLKPQPHKFLPTEIISGGKLLERNLAELNLSREWLDYELKRANVTLDQVNYAEIKSDGTIYLDKKADE